ncbi:MAG: hypothetical protein IKW46_07755 [Bacteroidaceae bacterium]|nr:hypothetical protein [Bacteroidaceae bacterium]
MRKFTLFLMSLFLTVGAMAQVPDPILELTAAQIGTTYPYEVSAEDADKVFALEGDLTIAVRINTPARLSGRMSLFATSDPTEAANSSSEGTNSRYVGYGMNGADGGYLASWRSGDRFTGGAGIAANTTGMIVAYVINRGQNSFRVYVNGSLSRSWDNAHADGFMSGYEIATPAMVKADHENAKIYIGGAKNSGGNGEVFNGTITGVKVFEDALSAEQIAAITFPSEEEEPAEVVVTDVEDLSNDKVYNLITTRGWLIYNSANADVVASTASYGTFATGADVEACQWAIYKSENTGKFYLYNIGAGKFVGRNADEGGRFPFVTDVTNDIQVVKNTTGTDYALVFSTDNYGAINHFNHTAVPGVANWKGNASQGGLRALNDAGSAHKVVEVADIAPATLNAIAEAVAVYEADNTDAVAALDAAIANARTMFDQITIGAGVGEYTATDADYEAKFQAIVTFRQAIQATNTPTPAEVEAKVAELNALIATFQLNMPVAGKYYTFCNGDNYITSVVDANGRIACGAKDASAIYYYDGEHLLAYTTGLYFGLNGSDWTFEAVGSNDISAINFVAAANGAIAMYNIQSGGRWLHISANGDGSTFVNRCSANTCGDAHNWAIKEVESLPVTVTAAGYATFFAPVAVQLPTGVTAHTVTINGEWATLSEALTVVPAETGVVLVGAGSHSLAITTTDATATSALVGTTAATYIAADAYVLSNGANGVGFYGAILNQQSNTAFLNNSHKAYLPMTDGVNAASYSFRFEDGTTGIENVEVENEVKAIFDLTGRKVESITERGIYIVGGKKVLVK